MKWMFPSEKQWHPTSYSFGAKGLAVNATFLTTSVITRAQLLNPEEVTTG